MKIDLLKEIIKKINSVKIGVVGDFCLDAYWFIDESKSEISIETGEVTRPVRQQKYSLGGAGNVTNNLAAMGVQDIRAFGVIGTDPFGEAMKYVMEKAGIKTNNLLVQNDQWATHVYTKPYLGDKEQGRIDFGNFNTLSEESADLLISNLTRESGEVDIIIINQQVLSGINTDYFRNKLVTLINMFPGKIFITDSRNFCDDYSGTYRKMNDNEAVSLCGYKKDQNEIISFTVLAEAARSLYERYQKPIFITRGERGSIVIDQQGVKNIPGLNIISRIDTVGAGDSYLAGLASTLAAGYDLATAAEIGTLVAGVTIQKLFQTGTASPEEILNIGQDPDFIYKPDLAENIRQAEYSGNTEIEIINKWPENLSIKYAIFDHDGTISTLREGWEKILAPLMIRAVLGEMNKLADDALYNSVRKQVVELIEKTTGVQTLVQMKKLIHLIREFGIVPEEQIMNESDYKALYNIELLRMVNKRQKKITAGELTTDDFTVKNIIPFLRRLKNAGVKLYLTSGTDVEDVRNEARFLGYKDLFEGGIHGAVGDITLEAKKIVLDHIFDTLNITMEGQVATFGDGPVEIRETQKRGGITIGVASDELKRYGLNEKKRTRLIKAGADIIIPDYTQIDQLLRLLNIK